MKSKNNVKAFVIVLIIAALALLGLFGLPGLGIPSIAGTRTGIDIQGGISVVMEPADEYKPTPDQLQSAKFIIESRLDSRAVFDRNVATDSTGGRILVEIPFRSDQNSSDLLAADYDLQRTVVEYIGRTANLTFRPVDESLVNPDGSFEMIEPVLVQGARVTDSAVVQNEGRIAVSLKFDPEGSRQFADATQQYHGQRIAIFMDDIQLTAPTVNAVI